MAVSDRRREEAIRVAKRTEELYWVHGFKKALALAVLESRIRPVKRPSKRNLSDPGAF